MSEITENLPATVDGEVLEGRVIEPGPVAIASRHARRAGRHGTRHAAYIPLGISVLAKRWWDNNSQSRYGKFIKMAEANGDHEAAAKWDELRLKFLAERRQRRHDRTASVINVAKASPYVVGVGAISEIGLGIAMAIGEHKFSAIGAPIEFTSHVIYWSIVAAGAAAVPAAIAAPCIFLSVAWHVGRRHAQKSLTGWLAPPKNVEDGHLVITADTIVLALQNLQIPALTRAFNDKEGPWRPTFTTLPVRSGSGYECEFSLPLGVTAEMIADKRAILARNVHRDEVETWPSAGAAGYVKLWITDPGAISKNAPEYPLQHAGQADVFRGVPAGISPRGEEILVPIVANNGLAGGLPGTGKSNAIRAILLGCCTDPICQVEAYVGALNGDFDAFAPRLARYVKGLDDEHIKAMVDRLQSLYDEVGRREARLAELGAKKLSRSLAIEHPDMRPIVAAFSECHELFGHSEHGKLAAELATKLVKRGRKTGVVAWFDTQSARKEAIPPSLVENVSVNCCFAVRNWRNNDGFLGDGAFASGVRATELSPQRDRGTALMTGVSDEAFELVKWYYIAADDDAGTDDATEVIERSMKTVAPGVASGGSSPVQTEQRDLLADLDEVLGNERVRLADIPALLRDLAPRWPGYRSMTGAQLRDLLDDEGVKTTNGRNVPTLNPADLREVLAAREPEQDDE
jgi:S-DNA-T family DNA segregation ATPase FtsK/SpoIIIE